ncbi:uncharacterized protein LOC121641405 [Melanotaenia boesemani]|uniref:uncharacterized protein LOC121641405 n=1 Tax=Melanotaenia boesemani TaxID=1250792 RepID=UPI001C056308|nr:uncharacterized protein LOC121641405 [Melanotaenia boesemani]
MSMNALLAMRPSISVSLEPGLDRGVPWGRDLYTFVTSAAGHMMRTLQKPRKNRPSKRQVNHRRFLHNMIQRKFADIEAANHRLASALYFKEGDKTTSPLLSHVPEIPDASSHTSQQDPEISTQQDHKDTDGKSKSRNNSSSDLNETEDSEKHLYLRHLWKRHPKSQSSTSTTSISNQSKRRQKKERSHKLDEFLFMSSPEDKDYIHKAELFHSEYYLNESQLKPISNLLKEIQTPLNNSSPVYLGQNEDILPSFSPELSSLSLDSCDFSVQMLTDLSVCTQSQKDTAEGQLTDIMDLFTAANKDSESCLDVEKDVECYFDSIGAYQGDGGLEVSADDDVTFAVLSHSFTGVEDLHSEGDEYRCGYGYSCYGDQVLATNYLQGNQRNSQTLRQSEYTAEKQFTHVKPTQSTNTNQDQLFASISYHCNITQLQTNQHSQEESPCMLVNSENNLNFTPFEGVAQSFSAPPHDPEYRPIPTPPGEDDWLFTDILKDRKSPGF